MKQIYCFYVVVLITTFCNFQLKAQDEGGEEVVKSKMVIYGDRSYDNGDFFLAADYYKKGLERNPEDAYAAYRLAEASKQFFDYDQAEKYYNEAYRLDGANFPLALFYHALMMKINGKYHDAADRFKNFSAIYEPSSEEDNFEKLSTLHFEGCMLALAELRRPQREFGFKNLDIPVNSEYSEYAPTIYKNDSNIVVTSGRMKKDGDEQYRVLGGAYSDNYWFDKASGSWEEVEGKLDEARFLDLNTQYNDGAGVFNPNRDKFYYTICGEFNEEKTQATCAIYSSKLINNTWSKPKRMNDNINMKGYWNAQPSLSATGDTMFFVSKRPGGYGQHDIWMSILEDPLQDESWGEPVNMGPEINTAFIEYSPFYYSKDKALFFASDGHQGFGGLDVFMASGDELKSIRNIGLPFNSNRDDMYFVLGEDRGYLASNREGGTGHDDIYTFDIESDEAIVASIRKKDTRGSDLITIQGRIMDDDGQPREGVGVYLINGETEEVLKMTTTDDEGVFVFSNLVPGIDYQVRLDEEDAADLTTHLDFQLDQLEILNAIDGAPLVFDDTKPPITDGSDEVANREDVMSIEDDPLIVDKAVDTIHHVTRYEGETVELKTEKHVLNQSHGKDGDVNENFDDIPYTPTPGKMLFEHIFFDFNKSKLNDEAVATLEDFLRYTRLNSGVKIELKAYTDDKGSDSYNKKLARRRGKSVYNYLIKNGVPAENVSIAALGESNALASNANLVGMQLNRRVEFYIVGGGAYEAGSKAYVTTTSMNVADLARQYNMSTEELKSLNNLNSDQLKAYQVVRVRRLGDEDIIAASTMQYAGSGSGHYESPVSRQAEASGYDDANSEYVSFDDTDYNMGVRYRKYNNEGYYVVLPKNTLFSIAKVSGTSVSELKKLNRIRGNTIFVGQKLLISEAGRAFIADADNTKALYDAGIRFQDQHGEIVMIENEERYIVKAGDTFYSLGQQFDLLFEELRSMNGLSSYVLRPGMPLRFKRNEDEQLKREEINKELLAREIDNRVEPESSGLGAKAVDRAASINEETAIDEESIEVEEQQPEEVLPEAASETEEGSNTGQELEQETVEESVEPIMPQEEDPITAEESTTEDHEIEATGMEEGETEVIEEETVVEMEETPAVEEKSAEASTDKPLIDEPIEENVIIEEEAEVTEDTSTEEHVDNISEEENEPVNEEELHLDHGELDDDTESEIDESSLMLDE